MTRLPCSTATLLLLGLVTATVATGCRYRVPSMVERMPPTPVTRAEERVPGPDPRDEPTARPGQERAPSRLVLRTTLLDNERFRAGVRVHAYVPYEAFQFVLTFRVEEVIEGEFDEEVLRVVVRSPMEQFAYPHSDHREFRLTLEPSRGSEYYLVGIEPPGSRLNEERARAAGDSDTSPERP